MTNLAHLPPEALPEAALPEAAFMPDDRERTQQDMGDASYAFYGGRVDPVTRRFRSEDYAFCDRARSVGLRFWLCPWIHADHIGNLRFSGTFTDTARLNSGLAPTPLQP